MQVIDGIFYIVILIMSIVIHEFAHGYVAYRLGDMTAHSQGRLTLNPLKHLDLFGSILLPLFLIISHAGFVIGWARPVPYNEHNLRHGKRDSLYVALAGVVANLLVVIFFGLLIRFSVSFGLFASLSDVGTVHPFYMIASTIVLTNLVLAIFNLMPIPPLDGSKILFSFIPAKYRHVENFIERWGMFLLLFFVLFLWKFISPSIYFVFHFLTGIS